MALFACLIIHTFQLVFSVGTIFFSHNNSARTVFFQLIQPSFSKPNGTIENNGYHLTVTNGMAATLFFTEASLTDLEKKMTQRLEKLTEINELNPPT